jgi:hypothetical protein
MACAKFATVEETAIPVTIKKAIILTVEKMIVISEEVAMIKNKVTMEETIVISEELAMIKNNYRRKWEKVESREEPDWLPPPPRRWLNPTRTRGVVIIGVGTDQFRRRSSLKTG